MLIKNISDDVNEWNITGNEESSGKILTDLVVIPFGIPICLENFLAIVILIRSSRLIYQVRILSINLAITDCLAGFILSIPDVAFGDCRLKKYFTAPFINVSLITVTMFNIDRCFSLRFALRYYEIVTPRFLKIACFFSWIVGILISYFMFYDPTHSFGIFCGIMYLAPQNALSGCTKVFQLLTILSNLIMYIYMAKLLYARFRKVTIQPSKENEKKSNRFSLQIPQPRRKQTLAPQTNYGQSARYQVRVVKKLAVITGFFLLCCTPYFLLKAIPNIDYSNRIMRGLTAVTAGVMFLNSAINPVLYVWRFTESRYQLKKMFFFWSPERLQKLESERNSFFATFDINNQSSTSN